MFERPWRLQVPPGEGIEQVVEAGARRSLGLLEGAAQGLGGEQAIGLQRLGGADERAPDIRRHLVGGVAAEPADAEILHPIDVAGPEPGQLLARTGRMIVQLGEVAPDRADRRIVRVDGGRALDVAGLVAQEQIRPLPRQGAVLGGVVDDEVGHHPDAVRGGGGAEAADLLVVRGAVIVAETLVEPFRVGDRVEAARAAGLVERIEVDPVEPHPGDAGKLRRPGRDLSHEEGEQVVDARPLGPGGEARRQRHGSGFGPRGGDLGWARRVHAYSVHLNSVSPSPEGASRAAAGEVGMGGPRRGPPFRVRLPSRTRAQAVRFRTA